MKKLLAMMILAMMILTGCGASDGSQVRLRTALDAKHDTLNRCYAKTLARDPDTQGTLKVVVHVPTNGTVDRVTMQSEDVTNKKLQACVKTALLGLAIPKPDDELSVEYTLELAPAVSVSSKPKRRDDNAE